jgi:hypothetical protein
MRCDAKTAIHRGQYLREFTEDTEADARGSGERR